MQKRRERKQISYVLSPYSHPVCQWSSELLDVEHLHCQLIDGVWRVLLERVRWKISDEELSLSCCVINISGHVTSPLVQCSVNCRTMNFSYTPLQLLVCCVNCSIIGFHFTAFQVFCSHDVYKWLMLSYTNLRDDCIYMASVVCLRASYEVCVACVFCVNAVLLYLQAGLHWEGKDLRRVPSKGICICIRWFQV